VPYPGRLTVLDVGSVHQLRAQDSAIPKSFRDPRNRVLARAGHRYEGRYAAASSARGVLDQQLVEGEQIDHPNRTADMGTEPDHGEESYRGSDRLKGKKAVTTGRDSGIGRAVAIAFAREGAYVLIVHLDSEKQDAATTLKLLEESGHNAVALAADVRDEQACQTIIDRAVQDLGGIDVLVSNAAYQMAQPGGIADITTEQFDRVIKTNLWAPSGWSRRRWSTCPRAGASSSPARSRRPRRHRS